MIAIRLVVKCFFVCAVLLFLAMILGVYVSAAVKGVDVVFRDVVISSAKDSVRGGAIMSVVVLLLILKNHLFHSKNGK